MTSGKKYGIIKKKGGRYYEKNAKMLAAIGLTGVALCNMTGCASLWDIIENSIDNYFKDRSPLIEPFEDCCVTTEDGFTYYVDPEIGLCLLSAPQVEELTIPEYIDGRKVVQLGYNYVGLHTSKKYCFDVRNTKIITIKQRVDCYRVNFSGVNTVIYYNPTNNIHISKDGNLLIDNVLRNSKEGYFNVGFLSLKEIILKKDDNSCDFNGDIKEVLISEYVTVIDSGVFDGLDGVTIKTSHESKPDGWEEGWNGNCPVEWGAEIQLGYEIQ